MLSGGYSSKFDVIGKIVIIGTLAQASDPLSPVRGIKRGQGKSDTLIRFIAHAYIYCINYMSELIDIYISLCYRWLSV